MESTFYYQIKEKVNLTLEKAIKTKRGLDVQLYFFFNLSVRWGVCSTPHPGRFTPWNDLVSVVTGGRAGPRAGLKE